MIKTRIFTVFFAVLLFTGSLFAQINVNNESGLKNEMNKAAPDMTVIRNIDFSADVGSYSGKNINIVFDAEGKILNGNGHRGFVIDNSTVSFTMRIPGSFTGFYGTGYGGALNLLSSSASFKGDLSFSGNETTVGGGAIYTKRSHLSFSDAGSMSFSGNKSSGSYSGSTGNGHGGAIFAFDGSKLSFNNIDNLDFKDNYATLRGGAVYIDMSQAEFSNIGSLVFEGNSALHYGGGALMTRQSTTTFNNIDSITFKNNEGSMGGGAAVEGKMTFSDIKELSFTDNIAKSGGALFTFAETNVTFDKINNVSFSGNKVVHTGGALDVGRNNIMTFSNIDNIDFKGNSADIMGGAINVEDWSDVIFSDIDSITFSDNSSVKELVNHGIGGAVKLSHKSNISFNNVEDLSFFNNVASSSGGAVFAYYLSSVNFNNVKNLQFTGNTADFSGGAIGASYYSSSVNIKNSNVKFNNNKANSGGAVYLEESYADFSGSTVTFSGNVALGSGGAVYAVNGSSISFANSSKTVFENNTAREGGAVYLSSASAVFDGHTQFISNSAEEAGGAIAMHSSTATFSGKVYFTSNTAATKAGGAISARDSYLDFSNADQIVFEGNKTVKDDWQSMGGAVHLDNSEAYFGGTAVFNNNESMFSGGAINANRSNIEFNDTAIFTGNTAIRNSGGAVLVEFSEFKANADITFSGNKALGRGGAISSLQSDITFGGNALFKDNITTGAGGAVEMVYTNMTFLEDAEFFNNATSGLGGVFYMTGSTGYLSYLNFKKDANFTDNESDNYGGAIASHYGSILFENDVLFDNNASLGYFGYGGAVYGKYSSITFEGPARFISNFAEGKGGAIAAYSSSISADKEILFDGNRTNGEGGAMFLDNSSVSLAGGQFLNNSAALSGGAIFADKGSVVKIKDGTVVFENNISESNGGGIFLNNASVHIEGVSDTIFKNNKAADSGGAAFVSSDGKLEIYGAVFSANEAAYGGALALSGKSYVMLTDVSFENNISSVTGGAVNMSGVQNGLSSLRISAVTKDVTFSGNKAGGKGNDFYLDKDSLLEFNAEYGKKIMLEGGILGTNKNNTVIKTGEGTLELAGSGNYEYYGKFNISKGKVEVKDNADVVIGNFEIGKGGSYSAADGKAGQVTLVGDAVIAGNLEMDVDFASNKADKIVAASGLTDTSTGKVTLESGSSLTLNMSGASYGETRITLIDSDGGVEGRFSNDPLSVLHDLKFGNVNYILEYLANRVDIIMIMKSDFSRILGKTHNQTEVANALDRITAGAGISSGMLDTVNAIDAMSSDNMRLAAMDQLAGSVIANSLTYGALSGGKNEFFDRMTPDRCLDDKLSRSIWGQVYTNNIKYDADENSVGEFSAGGYGIQAGADIFSGEQYIAGVYAGYGDSSIEQGLDKGNIEEFGFGVYGGWFGDDLSLKASVFAGTLNYEIKRNMTMFGLRSESEFSAYNVKADAKLEYKIRFGKNLSLVPFAGVQGGYVRNDEIKETGADGVNLTVYEGEYLRMEGLGGFGLNGKIKRLNWYGKVFAGYVFAGNKGEFDGEFENSGEKMNIWGADQSRLSAGAGAGAEYEITKRLSVYANAGASRGESVSAYYGNLGISYKFCGSKDKEIREAEKFEAEQERLRLEEAEKIKAEEERRRLEEEKIMQEISDAQLAIEKAEAEARRKRPMLTTVRLTMANFRTNEYFLTDKTKEEIAYAAEEIKKYDYKQINIEGHTDSTGTDFINKRLSRQRAKSVYDELLKNGISEEKMKYTGFAATMPIDTNATYEGRAANRRTEIFVE